MLIIVPFFQLNIKASSTVTLDLKIISSDNFFLFLRLQRKSRKRWEYLVTRMFEILDCVDVHLWRDMSYKGAKHLQS